MKVIGISGLPGSGKNLISTKASEKGFIVVNMGDCVREESLKRNEDSRVTAVKLREEYGKYVVANLTIQKIKELTRNIDDLSNKVIIVEGIRSPYEVNLFKSHFDDFKILSVFPFLVAAGLVFPIPNYHNVMVAVQEMINFYTKIKIYINM